jgi:UV radiation resistance-associated gene protein
MCVAYWHRFFFVPFRASLATLRARFAPVRSGLIATLAGIFPIELASPAELLFTVLGVPLPIPLGAQDPAPPLRRNEEDVASALGYAAQVVQMLAAYVGARLVYPVTCVGSRSLVKDEISAMVGPRM